MSPFIHRTFSGTHPLTQLNIVFSYRRMVCKAELLSSNQKISKLPSLEGVTALQQRSFLQYFLKDRSIAVGLIRSICKTISLVLSVQKIRYLEGSISVIYLRNGLRDRKELKEVSSIRKGIGCSWVNRSR